MNMVVLNKMLIDLDKATQYATAYIGEMDHETIWKTPEGLFILERSSVMQLQAPEYRMLTTNEVLGWLEGRGGVSFHDVETMIQDLGLSRPVKTIPPPATPDPTRPECCNNPPQIQESTKQ